MKRIFKILCAVVFAAIAATAAVGAADWFGFGGGNSIDVVIKKGAGSASVASTLKKSGVIRFESLYRLYAKISDEKLYQAGLHNLNSGMSYDEITEVLIQPPQKDNYTVTIPEGYEFRQIVNLLEENGIINREVFLREAESGEFDFDFVKQIPQRENRLEGYLFPDTYTFRPEDSEHDVILRMLENFNNKAMSVINEANSGKSIDEIIILSSIIEREAASDDDRGKIASVFVNRLNIGMKLESCATVQYILKERKSVLSNEDTQIDSPYNTYKNSGLPIGPIASPGIKSIQAALYPEQTNYLYFMAARDGKSSVFAETYEQHLENMKNNE